jgi:tetratricopeptide (TPR) repeat protein
LILALAAILPYARISTLGFTNFDDPGYVTQNGHVRAGLTWDGIVWAFTSTEQSNWHPLTWISHMLDSRIYGLNPPGHHVTNLLFHVLSTLLLFGVLLRMTGAPGRSALVAALFALHPLHVESVAWIAERKDVLSAFFWLLTLWAYVRYVETRRSNAYSLVVIALALGLMAKPMLVTLPFVLLLLDAWPLARLAPARHRGSRSASAGSSYALAASLVVEKIPLLLLALGSSVITYIAQQRGGAVVSFTRLPLDTRVTNAFVSYVAYVRKTFWPSDLAAFYPRPGPIEVWRVGISIALLGLVTFLVIRFWRTRPYLAVGWFWYLGTLVPVIGLIQVGDQALADRYAYLPSIGLFLMVVWAAGDALEHFRVPHRAAAGAAIALLSIFGILTWKQVGYWKSSESLFRRAIAITGDNELAYWNLGVALVSDSRLDEAAVLYQDILSRKPDIANILANFGTILVLQGRHEEAVERYRHALRVDPHQAEAHNGLGFELALSGKLDEAANHHLEALKIKPQYPEARYNLGKVYAAQGKAQPAIEQYREALRLRPGYADAHEKLAYALAGQGRIDEAIPQYAAAIQARPDSAELRYRYGLAIYQRHRAKEAISELREALRLKPDWPDALNNLAWILATDAAGTRQDAEKALTHILKAIELTGQPDATLIDTLAAAHAATGRFDNAVRSAEQAIRLATAAGDTLLAAEIERRCRLYRSGKRYFEQSQ